MSATPKELPAPHPLIDVQFGVELWKKTLIEDNSHIPDYTFEERYIRNTPRPSYPERDEVCFSVPHFHFLSTYNLVSLSI